VTAEGDAAKLNRRCHVCGAKKGEYCTSAVSRMEQYLHRGR